jgi:hypothetical protein
MGTAGVGKGRGLGLTVSQLDKDQIRKQWTDATGDPPPRYVSRTLLMRMLADRIQSAEHGGVPPRLKRRLLAIATTSVKGGTALRTPPRRLTPGTVLVRDWKGARHQVMVLKDGFAYDGQTFGSLSEVARKITGTRWSGPVFFGVQKARRRSDQIDPQA